MKKNKIIINYCPNFYKIINFDFFEGDYISEKLVKIYKDFIFDIDLENEDDIYMVKQMDFVVNKYIEDYYFRKEMQRSMINIRVKKSSQLVRDIAQSIINCFDLYENGYTRNIYFARWI
ncbi:MAG: hypothetical protein PHD03_00330 [Bacilli bacterium]|nr:hypothetical protein [Bacilli bacterium]MDD4406652.1 hypothetical protein [Bacilli bacterium]